MRRRVGCGRVRRSRAQRWALVVALVVALALAAGCSTTAVHPSGGFADPGATATTGPARSGAPAGPPSGSIAVGEFYQIPDNLMPISFAGGSHEAVDLLSRVLLAPFRLYPDHAVRPDLDLLAAPPTSGLRDGRQVVTYRLNPKAVWSDGTPISAGDFTYTWQLQRDEGCQHLISAAGYQQVESVRGGDGGSVEVTFSRPYGDWRALFQLYPRHAMPATGLCEVLRRGWPVTSGIPGDLASGPYQLTRSNLRPGRSVTLTANPKWWGAGPHLAEIEVRAFGEQQSGAEALRAGRVQAVLFPRPTIAVADSLRGSPFLAVDARADLQFEHLDFNTGALALADERLRRAVALGIDRPALLRATVGPVGGDLEVVNNRFFTTGEPEYRDNSGGRYDRPDPAGAAALLEQAGYRRGTDGIYAKGGRRLALDVSFLAGNLARQQVAQVLAEQLRPVGIQIRPKPTPEFYGTSASAGSLASGQWQLAVFSWVVTPYAGGTAPVYRGDDVSNYGRGRDPRVDTLVDQVRAEPDPARQADLANQADSRLWDDLFTLPLFEQPVLLATARSVHGAQANDTLSGPFWNCDEWWQDR